MAAWRTPLTVIAVVLTASCASSADSAGTGGLRSGGSSATGTAVSFDAFVASLSSARYQDYATGSGARVRDQAAFQEMRNYLQTMYQDTVVSHSYTDVGGGVFDCVRQGRPTASAPAPAPATVPTTAPATVPSGAASSAASGAAGCPQGSVPTRRITLDDLVRFPTLQDFLGKSPGGGGLPPIPSSSAS